MYESVATALLLYKCTAMAEAAPESSDGMRTRTPFEVGSRIHMSIGIRSKVGSEILAEEARGIPCHSGRVLRSHCVNCSWMAVYTCVYIYIFSDHVCITLGTLWAHLRFILKLFWDRVGVNLGSFWIHSGVILALGLPPLPEIGSWPFNFILIGEWEIVIGRKIK